jgi:branched-chain amino acid transport system substrate-binding protein
MTNSKTIRYLLLPFFFIALPLSDGITPAKAASDEWKIPVLMLTTGPYAAMGLEALNVSKFAAEEINAAGGIRGKSMKIVGYDTAADPARALSAARDVAPWALIILGPATSFETQSAIPVAVNAGITMLTPSISTLKIVKNNAPWSYTFRTDPVWSAAMGVKSFVKMKPNLKTFVRFQESTVGGYTVQGNAVSAAFAKHGVKELQTIKFEAGEISWAPQVTKARALKPDYYCIVSSGRDAARMAVELRKQGDRKQVFAGEDFEDAQMLRIGGDSIEGTIWYSVYFVDLKSSRWEKFKRTHREKIKKDTIYPPAVLFYDAIYLIKDAIEKTGITGNPGKLKEERIMIRDYIRSVRNFQGANGNFSLTPEGHSEKTVYMLQIKNGKPMLLDSLEPGT